MGPSMSNPNVFRQRNRQRHLQAYERKHHTEISLDSKIKLKNVTQFTSDKHRDTYKHQTIMKKQNNKTQPQQNLYNINQNTALNQQIPISPKVTPIKDLLTQQFSAYSEKHNTNHQSLKKDFKFTKPQDTSVINSPSKQTSTRKIVLNNQSYEIDIQKMKNRRLRSKQRYTNSILLNHKNLSRVNGFNTKPSMSTNSMALGVSTLQLQSQLHPITQQHNISQSQYENVLESSSRENNGKALENRDICQKEKQMVRAEYYEQYVDNFESRGSRKGEQKIKQSKSGSKLLKTIYVSKTQKVVPKIQYSSEYYMQSKKQIKSKKSFAIISSNQSHKSPETALSQSQSDNKKALKIIKVYKK